MNQEYAEMDLLPNDPRTTSRRSIGASAGIEAGAGAKASAGAESGTEARQARTPALPAPMRCSIRSA